MNEIKVMWPGGLSPEEFEERKGEPLDPALMEYVRAYEYLGEMVDHPLVRCSASMPCVANAIYSSKKAWLEQVIAAGDWTAIVDLHENHHRLEAFLQYVAGRDARLVDLDIEMRELATLIWSNSERIWEERGLWEGLFRGWRPGDGLLLADGESRDVFESMPESFVVFRGSRGPELEGTRSWTTSKERALWYAQRFPGSATLMRGMVDKAAVVGCISSEQDLEYVIDTRHIRKFKSTKVARTVDGRASETELAIVDSLR